MATNHDNVIEDAPALDLGRYWPFAAAIAVIGGLLFFVIGMGLNVGEQMWGSYMFGLLVWIAVTLGCFGLVQLHHAIRPTWSTSIIRLLEAGSGWPSMLAMAALLVPVVLVVVTGHLPSVYIWTNTELVKHDPILLHKAIYLSPGFWTVRLIFYFALWSWWSWNMRRSTTKQDETKNFRLEAGRQSWGAAGIVMTFITGTFLVVDLIMSMEPHWYSTMYGAWLLMTAGYGALALCVFVICSNWRFRPFVEVVRPDLTNDLGNMLFVLTMLWGYTTLSQFLIIWNGNLPETTSYFVNRGSGVHPPGMETNNWGIVGFFMIIGTFFIPFFNLLAPRTKRYPGNLRRVALWMFFMMILNMFLIVVPSLPGRAVMGPFSAPLITDLLALLAVGGVWFLVFFAVSRRAPLLPLYDTRLQEAARNAH